MRDFAFYYYLVAFGLIAVSLLLVFWPKEVERPSRFGSAADAEVAFIRVEGCVKRLNQNTIDDSIIVHLMLEGDLRKFNYVIEDREDAIADISLLESGDKVVFWIGKAPDGNDEWEIVISSTKGHPFINQSLSR